MYRSLLKPASAHQAGMCNKILCIAAASSAMTSVFNIAALLLVPPTSQSASNVNTGSLLHATNGYEALCSVPPSHFHGTRPSVEASKDQRRRTSAASLRLPPRYLYLQTRPRHRTLVSLSSTEPRHEDNTQSVSATSTRCQTETNTAPAVVPHVASESSIGNTGHA